MQEIKTEIDISAPPSKVWAIITDINNWQEWSPIINASNGKASIGSKLSILTKIKYDHKNIFYKKQLNTFVQLSQQK